LNKRISDSANVRLSVASTVRALQSSLRNRGLLTAGAFLLLGLVVAFVPPPGKAVSPATHQIRVQARKFAFSPHRIRVRQGDRVLIELESMDVVHGLYVDGYDVQTTAEPGVPGQLAFVADRTGKFRFRCSVTCGTLHPFMIGELVVEPNFPFWRATALTLVAVIGTLAVLAVRSTEEDET